MNLKIETHVADGVTIVSCHGRIMFGEEATSLRETLKKVLSSNRHIVLNLAGVTYVDSGGLGTLVGVYSSARAGGADIKLTGLGQRLRTCCKSPSWLPSSRGTTVNSRGLPHSN